MPYADKCASCKYSQGIEHPRGGVAKLTGDWIVNQYGGSEGYLGWLALQPRFHYNDLSDLTATELHALGPNLKDLDGVLKQYWRLQFPADEIRRVYIVYFFESKFRKTCKEDEEFHLHIHVIPRFESLGQPGGLLVSKCGVTWVDGWQVPLLFERGVIPEPYRRDSPMWESRATQLMDYIRNELAIRP